MNMQIHVSQRGGSFNVKYFPSWSRQDICHHAVFRIFVIMQSCMKHIGRV